MSDQESTEGVDSRSAQWAEENGVAYGAAQDNLIALASSFNAYIATIHTDNDGSQSIAKWLDIEPYGDPSNVPQVASDTVNSYAADSAKLASESAQYIAHCNADNNAADSEN